MRKTTVYVPEDLKTSLEQMAAQLRVSEAELIRQAILDKVGKPKRPRPKVPLLAAGLGNPTVADRVDELLEGFGQS